MEELTDFAPGVHQHRSPDQSAQNAGPAWPSHPGAPLTAIHPAGDSRRITVLQRLSEANPTSGWTSDGIWLERLANGEREVFWDLWAMHQPAVFGLCLEKFGGRHAEAEDACSRVMQKAHQVLPEMAADIRNVGGWLARMTVNLCIDVQRTDRRRFQGLCAVELEALSDEMMALLSDCESCPDRVFLRSEMADALASAVAALPIRLRESARLYFFEDRSYAEIEERLKTSSANIRKRIQEARTLLRDALREYAPCVNPPAVTGKARMINLAEPSHLQRAI